MELNISEPMKKEKKMVKENYCLPMNLNMLEIFWIMKFQVLGNIIGQMEKFIRDSGKIIK